MLNIEKFKDELIELEVINSDALAVSNGRPCRCGETECKKCELYSEESACMHRTDNWLFSEYKEPEVDWSKIKVDTQILVKENISNGWKPRYFAKFENGYVYSFADGKTSWSARESETIAWGYAKLAESEE